MNSIEKDIPASLSPAEVFRRLCSAGIQSEKPETFSFLLESPRFHPSTGLCSFIGFDPSLVFKSKKNRVEVLFKTKRGWRCRTLNSKSPLRTLQTVLSAHFQTQIQAFPDYPFAAGYVSYDYLHFLENIPDNRTDDLLLPDIFFILCSTLIAFDHGSGKATLLVCPSYEDESALDVREKLEVYLEQLRAVKFMLPISPCFPQKRAVSARANMTEEEFLDKVLKIKAFIAAGDIYQANLSRRLKIPFSGEGFHLYEILRSINPSPFSAFLHFGGHQVVSCSPERLLRLSGGAAETRPIAGTRPRGDSPCEDRTFASELFLSEKERAEHLMLLDLERNDLGKVCRYGSVHVSEFMVREDYSHVFHIVSNVKGKLQGRKTWVDALEALFPGGTITGCPKVRCMEILSDLEPTCRGIYTGSIGYVTPQGSADFNIAIRTLILKNGSAYIQTGSGIVADSEPEKEYHESLYKAQALLAALEQTTGNALEGVQVKKFLSTSQPEPVLV